MATTAAWWRAVALRTLYDYSNILWQLRIAVWLAAVAVGYAKEPFLRIFILAGDDNVEGYASLAHLHELITSPAKPNASSDNGDGDGQNQEGAGGAAGDRPVSPYSHLMFPNKSWVVRDDVFISYDHVHEQDMLHGPLRANGGFGSSPKKFGPEVQFGWTLGDVFDEPILLIKAGWSGRTLARDFKPPSEGQSPAGYQYVRIWANLRYVLAHLDKVVGPSFKDAKHKVCGVVWWHGYSDLKDPQYTKTYGDHLAAFLNALRKELGNSGLPIVVGELGGAGLTDVSPSEKLFRQMQQTVCNSTQFRYNTFYVPTARYVRAYEPRPDDYNHYYGRADTMIEIGQAFGVKMAEEVLAIEQAGNIALLGMEINTKMAAQFLEILAIIIVIPLVVNVMWLSRSRWSSSPRRPARRRYRRVNRRGRSAPGAEAAEDNEAAPAGEVEIT